jgi:hypothetical protein
VEVTDGEREEVALRDGVLVPVAEAETPDVREAVGEPLVLGAAPDGDAVGDPTGDEDGATEELRDADGAGVPLWEAPAALGLADAEGAAGEEEALGAAAASGTLRTTL